MRTKSTLYAWSVAAAAVAILVSGALADSRPVPPLTTFVFWILILMAANLLPVAMGFGVQVTMAFPILLALILVFSRQPWVAMLIAVVGTVDIREFKRQIALHKAVFNRAEHVVAIAIASIPALGVSTEHVIASVVGVALAALSFLAVNLGLVAIAVALESDTSLGPTLVEMVPRPVFGFLLSYSLVATIGVAAATVYQRFPDGAWLVTAALIPLFFASQELAERLREQQQRQLEVTERAFTEREVERRSIAAEIHDTSLQMLAAATFGAENALSFLDEGELDLSRRAMVATQSSVKQAITDLRASVTDLRESLLEHEHLEDSLQSVIEQLAVFWGVEVGLRCEISKEPSVPVAMAVKQIVNEAVTNALKHSESEDIRVRVTDSNGTLAILVEDNGPGFDEEKAAAASGHMGLELMKERASAVGGRLRIESTHSGTRLEALFPGVGSA
jgi:signal transduction histidine kinase